MTERASRILCLLVAAAMPGIAGAKTPEQIFQLASQSVVVVQAQDAEGNPINQGGGVVTGRELVTTNCHVIEGAAAIEVLYRYQSYAATPASANEDRDLCQIRVPELVAPRAKLNTGRVRVGQRVYAIGAPEGLELTLTEGLISSLREFDGSQYIQTSAAIAQGSSGGGLFDTEARLIGITSFFVGEGSSLNFALPAAWIVELERGVGARAGGQEPAEARWARRIGDARAKKDWPGSSRSATSSRERDPRRSRLPIPRVAGIVRPAVVSSGVLLTRSPPPVRAGLSSQPLVLIRLQGAGTNPRSFIFCMGV